MPGLQVRAMTSIRLKKTLGMFISAAGLSMALAAVFAEHLGLEHDTQWGPARKFLLGSGIIVAIAPHLGAVLRALLGRCERAIERRIQRFMRDRSSSPVASEPTCLGTTADFMINVIAPFLVAVTTLTWIASAGRWTNWPGSTSYFHLLADGFRAGKLHLLVEPHPTLLALEDPYPYENRAEVPHLWDASLYRGKYYLYWGPTPALAVIALEFLLPIEIGDHHLTWLFMGGVIFWTLLILWRIRIRFFPCVRPWLGMPVAFAAALATPCLWLASRGQVYEAAIAGGQFFFLAGLYALLMARLQMSRHGLLLAVTGVCWSLAVASRITLSPAVILLALVCVGQVIRRSPGPRSFRRGLRATMPLMAVLILAAVLLAAYNQARFGSIWEIGHSYQLGRGEGSTRHKNMISLSNLPMNSYNYLLNPPKRIAVFPFVKPEWGKYAIPFLRFEAPSVYHTEKVVGLIVSTPLILLGGIPVVRWFWRFWKAIDSPGGQVPAASTLFHEGDLASIHRFLGLAALAEAGPLLLFTASTERHLMDITPTLLLLAGIGLWHAWSLWRGRPARSLLLSLAAWLLALYTMAMGVLLAFTGYGAQFESHNPELFERLMRFFAW